VRRLLSGDHHTEHVAERQAGGRSAPVSTPNPLGVDTDHPQSLTLLLLHPLAVAVGAVEVATTWASGQGLKCFYSTAVRIDEQKFQGLWGGLIPQRQPARVRVFRELLTHADAFVLGLAARPDLRVDIARLVAQRKGPSDPGLCDPTSLRAVLGAANVLNNLVHSPDDAQAARRELRVLIDTSTVDFYSAAALHTRASRNGLSPPPHRPSVELRYKDGLGVHTVAVTFVYRQRLLRHLDAISPCRHKEVLRARAALLSQLAEENEWLRANRQASPVDQLRRYRLSHRALHDVAVRAYACGRCGSTPATVLRSLQVLEAVEQVLLVAPGRGDGSKLERAWHRLPSGAAAQPDDRERLVLLSQAASEGEFDPV